jgi:hypothetical protein
MFEPSSKGVAHDSSAAETEVVLMDESLFLSKQDRVRCASWRSRGMSWHPHVMMFVSRDAAKSWGADQAASPIIAANDPEERVTIMMIWVGNLVRWVACSADGAMTPRHHACS